MASAPGLVRMPGAGSGIEVEVWGVPVARVGAFLSSIGAPFGLGTIRDGRGGVAHLWANAPIVGRPTGYGAAST